MGEGNSSDNFFNALDSMNITVCLKIGVGALIMQNKIVVYERFDVSCSNQFCSLPAIKSVTVGYGGIPGC